MNNLQLRQTTAMTSLLKTAAVCLLATLGLAACHSNPVYEPYGSSYGYGSQYVGYGASMTQVVTVREPVYVPVARPVVKVIVKERHVDHDHDRRRPPPCRGRGERCWKNQHN